VPLRTQVALIIGIAVVVWTIFLSVFGQQELKTSLLAPMGATIATVTVAAVVFEKFVWRWHLLRGWLVTRPDLQGTWKARLVSNFASNGSPTEKVVYAVVRQSLTSLTLRLYTDKAKSASIASSLYVDGGDLFTLSISYQNVPDVEQRNGDSEIHYGAALFRDIDWVNRVIKGHYWTDRKTQGSLVLMQHSRECVSTYDDAVALFT
jgi:hypothetical protein